MQKIIIFSFRFLQVILDRVHQLAEEEVKKYISCLALMCRLLINISHDNELCCSKLGQIEGFLPNAITTFTYLAPKFGKENSYDINVMVRIEIQKLEIRVFNLNFQMTSLLTNLVERCNANRKVLIAQTVKVCEKKFELYIKNTLISDGDSRARR